MAAAQSTVTRRTVIRSILGAGGGMLLGFHVPNAIAAVVAASGSLRVMSLRRVGAAGFTEDFPLASLYSMGRWLQIADGPDEVHRRSVARAELRG